MMIVSVCSALNTVCYNVIGSHDPVQETTHAGIILYMG